MSGTWSEELEGVYKAVGGYLKLELDLDKIKSARPKIAALLAEEAIGYLDALSGCCGGSGHELLGDIVDVVAPCKFERGQRVLAMSSMYIRINKSLKN